MTRRPSSHGRTVALTGVHTPLGRALVRRLDADEGVRRLVLLDRRAPADPLRRTVFHAVDLTATFADARLAELLLAEGVDTVVHGAFHATPRRDLESAHELEVIGTRALLHAIAHDARHRGTVEQVVALGTTLAYGAFPDHPQYLDEEVPLRAVPDYPFMADRVAIEREVAGFRDRTGLATCMVRLAPMVGASDTLAARLLESLLVPAVLGTDPLVQIVHRDDAVEAVSAIVREGYDGPLNVTAVGVLPYSTLMTLAGCVRVPAPAGTVRAALEGLWRVGLGIVPGAHVAFLRDTCVADPQRAIDRGIVPPRSITHAIADHVRMDRRASAAA